MNNQVSILNCLACGASLDSVGSSLVIRCRFCGNVVQVSGVVPLTQPTALFPALEEIRLLARGGKMLDAIKRYRAIYNVGLAEAKNDIEALQAKRWMASSPKNLPSRSGKFWVVPGYTRTILYKNAWKCSVAKMFLLALPFDYEPP